MVDNQKLPGVPPGGGSFTHGEAVAKTHLAAFERGRTGQNYLLAGADSNYVEFVKIIGELLGRKVPKRAAPGVLLRFIGRVNAAIAVISGMEPDISRKVRHWSANTPISPQPKPRMNSASKPSTCLCWLRIRSTGSSRKGCSR